jgi:hypothetical protein
MPPMPKPNPIAVFVPEDRELKFVSVRLVDGGEDGVMDGDRNSVVDGVVNGAKGGDDEVADTGYSAV